MSAATDPAADRLPPQTKFIVGNEACERFSFYGMIGILTLYIKNQLEQGPATASEISHFFKFGVYFMPLFGAWLSDRVLGRYRTILYISLFYCAGHGLLALGDVVCPMPHPPAVAQEAAQVAYETAKATTIESRLWFLYAGLTLLSFGGGGIKPCVSAFVGDQFKPDQAHLLQKAYGLFYWSINFGSFFSFLLIPRIRDQYGYAWAFGVPGIFMAVATLVFWLGRKHYQHVPPSRGKSGGYWGMLWFALTHQAMRPSGKRFWSACEGRYSADEIEACRAASRVLGVFALIPFFWALWDQSSTTWVIQGEKMTPYLFPEALQKSVVWPVIDFIAGKEIGAEQMQSMNSLVVMILVPLFTYWLFPLTEKVGVRVTTLRRMCVGMFLVAASFVLVAWIEQTLVAGRHLSVLWQTWPYIVLTAGEVLVSNTALEFAYSEAPISMRSTIMSFWFLTVAAGNLGVAQLFKLNVQARLPNGDEVLYISGIAQFYLFALLLAVVSVGFVFVTRRYRYRAESAA